MTRPLRFLLPLLFAAALVRPAAAEDAPAAKPFEVAPIAANAWYGRFASTNCSWMELGDGVLVIDAGASGPDAVNLLAEIKRTTGGKPVKWIVLTHLHTDSNGGLPALLRPDVTIFVHEKVAGTVGTSLEKFVKTPTVVGVPEHLSLNLGGHRVELLGTRGAAHTDHDVVAFFPELSAAYVGDLITGGRCPIMTDASTDPKGWLAMLDRVLALQPAIMIPTRGNGAVKKDVAAPGSLILDDEVKATRAYIDRLLRILEEKKKENSPESGVSSALRLSKTGDYCPTELDALNGLALYRRLTKAGDFPPAKPPVAGAAQAPATTAAPAKPKR